ncbi:C-X-C motif chemokine 3-like [Xyrauchen texanus]|uniref:C-X-C motif chemokine 3-like n=1 Tax=Xyrauchen texanus TaxID=154827 RepID=UPI002241AFDF|nr:C-X-C motif chemokine 3-like [Xyrauchen texanus]
MPLILDLLHCISDLILNMSLRTYLLLAAVAVCCFSTLLAVSMEGFNKCHCLITTDHIIPSRFFKRIEILPPGAHCRKTEILITKKDNKTVCVDPKAKWFNNIVSKVMKSKRAVKETSDQQRQE